MGRENYMKPTENDSQVDDQTFRAAVLEHLQRQTQALEFMRGVALFFTALFVIGVVVWVVQTLRGA